MEFSLILLSASVKMSAVHGKKNYYSMMSYDCQALSMTSTSKLESDLWSVCNEKKNCKLAYYMWSSECF